MGQVLFNEKRREFAVEVSRLASMANKRLKRLEKNELDSPAYRDWVKNGEVRFSVKGKDYNELQSEYWRIQHFIESKTSTVKGAIKNLEDIAEMTNIQYENLDDLKAKVHNFFELSDKIAEYYNLADKQAEGLDYQAIWQQINTMVDDGLVDLSDTNSDMAEIVGNLSAIGALDYASDYINNFSDNISEIWDLL